jgi:hypothetical protein
MLRTMASKPSLRKALGVFDGIAILIGISLGADIYSTPQIITGIPFALYWCRGKDKSTGMNARNSQDIK